MWAILESRVGFQVCRGRGAVDGITVRHAAATHAHAVRLLARCMSLRRDMGSSCARGVGIRGGRCGCYSAVVY